MAEVRCVRIKLNLKPNSLDRTRHWADELKRREEEVLEALVDEGVSLEAAFLEQTSDGDYLIYVMKANELSHADHATETSERPIEAFHRDFKEATFESGERLEQLIFFER